jgi:hypothetical protein
MKDHERRLHRIRHGGAKASRTELLYLTFREKFEKWWDALTSLEWVVLICNGMFLSFVFIDVCDLAYYGNDWKGDLAVWLITGGMLFTLNWVKKH